MTLSLSHYMVYERIVLAKDREANILAKDREANIDILFYVTRVWEEREKAILADIMY
jgi:long-subunit acyl-CoA synthetase (AMP-forming)